MSNSPQHSTERLPDLDEVVSLRHSARYVAAPLRFVGFWLAIALPFLYLPLLVGGLQGEQPLVFGGLLAVNVVALVVGHGYRDDRSN